MTPPRCFARHVTYRSSLRIWCFAFRRHHWSLARTSSDAAILLSGDFQSESTTPTVTITEDPHFTIGHNQSINSVFRPARQSLGHQPKLGPEWQRINAAADDPLPVRNGWRDAQSARRNLAQSADGHLDEILAACLDMEIERSVASRQAA